MTLWEQEAEAGSFHTHDAAAAAAAGTVDRSAGAEAAAAEQRREIEDTAGEEMEKGRRVQVRGYRIHGGPVVGGDDKRQDRRSSWCRSIGLLVKPWTGVDESTLTRSGFEQKPDPVTRQDEFWGV